MTLARFTDFALFGLISTSFGAAILAALPNLRSDRRKFSDRFLYFLWRYCLPIWGFEEVVLRILFGRFYP
jgi:hypothetical protein